jgi:RNA polymerase sigma factor (sigma-70 family)
MSGTMPDIQQVMGPDDDRHNGRFERLFGVHVEAVHRWAVRRDPAGADDIVADTFAIAWRRLADVPVGAAELPWLLGVARRVRANALRGERRRAALAERLGREPGAAPELFAVEEGGLHEALARVPERDRELLMLVCWEGLDHAAAASAMGMTRANVAVRLHRARRRLARELQRLDGGGRAVAATTAVACEEGRHV